MRKKRWIRINSVIMAAIMACSVALSQPVYATEADTQNAQEITEEKEISNENEGVSDPAQSDTDDGSSESMSTDPAVVEESEDGVPENSASDQEGSEEENGVVSPEDNTSTPDGALEDEKGKTEESAIPEKKELLTLTADDFPEISSYEAFIEQLPVLEGYAQELRETPCLVRTLERRIHRAGPHCADGAGDEGQGTGYAGQFTEKAEDI